MKEFSTPSNGRSQRTAGADWRWLLLGVAIWSGLFSYATYHGLAMTSDSWNYAAAAQSFAATSELRDANGLIYRAWPPLFPVILAVWAKLVPFGWAWLQGGCLAVSLVLWARLGQELLTHKFLIRLYVLVLAFSTPWLMCSAFLWSEPVFILLLSAYFHALYHYGKNGKASTLLIATLCGALLPLQRVSGFFVLAGAGLGVTVVYPIWAWRQRWRLLVHGLVVVAAGCVWQYYALVVAASRDLQNVQEWSVWGQAAADFGHAMGRWLTPLTTRAAQAYGPYAVAFLLVNVVGLALPGPRFLRLLAIVLPVTLVPLVPLAWLGQSGAGLTDADRYTAVMYAPFFLLLFAQVQRLLVKQSAKRQQLILAVSLFWLLYPAARMVRNAVYLHERRPVPASLLRLP